MSYEDFATKAVKGHEWQFKLVGSMGRWAPGWAIRRLYGLVAYNGSSRTREIRQYALPLRGKRGRAAARDGPRLVMVGMGTVLGLAMCFAVEQLRIPCCSMPAA